MYSYMYMKSSRIKNQYQLWKFNRICTWNVQMRGWWIFRKNFQIFQSNIAFLYCDFVTFDLSRCLHFSCEIDLFEFACFYFWVIDLAFENSFCWFALFSKVLVLFFYIKFFLLASWIYLLISIASYRSYKVIFLWTWNKHAFFRVFFIFRGRFFFIWS